MQIKISRLKTIIIKHQQNSRSKALRSSCGAFVDITGASKPDFHEHTSQLGKSSTQNLSPGCYWGPRGLRCHSGTGISTTGHACLAQTSPPSSCNAEDHTGKCSTLQAFGSRWNCCHGQPLSGTNVNYPLLWTPSEGLASTARLQPPYQCLGQEAGSFRCQIKHNREQTLV